MARGNGSATDTADATNAATGTETGGGVTELSAEDQAKLDAKRAQRKARRAQRSYVVVPMPPNLKDALQADATAKDQTIGPFVRDLLASMKGIEIPVTVSTRRVKYGSDEERDAARKARRESRSFTMKNLMAEFRKLTASGLSPEEATARAASNVAGGISTPEPAGEAVPA
jgi:hypothetical protein